MIASSSRVLQVADAGGSLPLALGGGAAVAALSVALIATDPDKRYLPMHLITHKLQPSMCMALPTLPVQFCCSVPTRAMM